VTKLQLFLGISLFVGCNYKTPSTDYGTVELKTDIFKNLAFEIMNHTSEYDNMPLGDRINADLQVSTNAEMVVINDTWNQFVVVDRMTCRSWMQDDSLWVHISNETGFTGHGLNIKINKGKFKCTPFYSTDLIIVGEKEPEIFIETQKVVLNKDNFTIGDSLYGYVYMRATVKGLEKNGLEKKYAMGFFRTKIQNN
jgi:hypothetical protein